MYTHLMLTRYTCTIAIVGHIVFCMNTLMNFDCISFCHESTPTGWGMGTSYVIAFITRLEGILQSDWSVGGTIPACIDSTITASSNR